DADGGSQAASAAVVVPRQHQEGFPAERRLVGTESRQGQRGVERMAAEIMSKVLYDASGTIARITINRPEAMNAFALESARLLGERLRQFDADPALRVASVTGAGDKAFCAGADLKKMHGGSHEGGINELWDFERQNRLGQRLQTVKPIIAAINGYCLAGGLELALGSDIPIASTPPPFGCPPVRWSNLHGLRPLPLPPT